MGKLRSGDEKLDQRIAWKSGDDAMNEGMVTPLSDGQSRVQVNIVYEPEGVMETVGNETGAVALRVKKDLEQFKEIHRITDSSDRCLARRSAPKVNTG